MTVPAGVLSLAVRVMLPTFSVAPVMLVVAVATVWPTTSGTVTRVAGSTKATVIVTAVPVSTVLPPTGACLMTVPAATVVLAS